MDMAELDPPQRQGWFDRRDGGGAMYSQSDQVASQCGLKATQIAAIMPVMKASPQAINQRATMARSGSTAAARR